ncbi:MAG: zinc ribbon domain-containing protein [Promethearchaeota archaeon]
MSLSSFRSKILNKTILFFYIIFFLIFINFSFQNLTHVHAQIYNYDDEIELQYGISVKLTEVSLSPNNIFGGSFISGFYIRANFSSNNGSIWINDQNDTKIWENHLNETFELFLDVNSTSIRNYSLWVNSSTTGNNTLYYTFKPEIISIGNIGLIVILIFLPIIITIIIVVGIVRKKEPHSVRVAKRITERMFLKFEAKHQEKLAKNKMKFCSKCGAKVQDDNNSFCIDCGSKLRNSNSKPIK